jgi:hypothetical protein
MLRGVASRDAFLMLSREEKKEAARQEAVKE